MKDPSEETRDIGERQCKLFEVQNDGIVASGLAMESLEPMRIPNATMLRSDTPRPIVTKRNAPRSI